MLCVTYLINICSDFFVAINSFVFNYLRLPYKYKIKMFVRRTLNLLTKFLQLPSDILTLFQPFYVSGRRPNEFTFFLFYNTYMRYVLVVIYSYKYGYVWYFGYIGAFKSKSQNITIKAIGRIQFYILYVDLILINYR